MLADNESLVTPIIIHWQSVNSLKELLSLFARTGVGKTIVVDNSQLLNSRQIRTWHKPTRLISNDFNRGFAFAANQGAATANSKWLLFLNPDVKVTAQQIKEMVHYATKNQLGALSPQPSSPDYSKPLPSPFSILVEFTWLHRFFPLAMLRSRTLTGGCLLIKRDVFRQLGGWDERFFLWFEDSDLTTRLRNAKHNISWCPIDVVHRGGESVKLLSPQEGRDIFFHSLSVYADKHFNWIGRKIAQLVKARYSSRNLLPTVNPDLACVVVPNLKIGLLDKFLNHNAGLLKKCEPIVVTSGIENSTVWHWRLKYPLVRFIILGRNRGFARTVNVGLRAATGKIAGTCNDDVLLEKDWLPKLASSLVRRVGSVNPLIFGPENHIESAGITLLKRGVARPITNYSSQLDVSVDSTNAACVLYSQEALNRVGLFDERFGSYLEDIDLSLRLSRNKYLNILNPRVRITHFGHQTSQATLPLKAWLDARNWWLVVIKNWSLRDWFNHWPSILLERARNSWGIVKSLAYGLSQRRIFFNHP